MNNAPLRPRRAVFVMLALAALAPATMATIRHHELFHSPNGRFELRLLPGFDKGRNETWVLVDTKSGRQLYSMHEILSYSSVFVSDDGQYLADVSSAPPKLTYVVVRLWRAGRLRAAYTAADLGLDRRFFYPTSAGDDWVSLGPDSCPRPFVFKDPLLVVTSAKLQRLTFDLSRGAFYGSEPAVPMEPGDLLVYGDAAISPPELGGVVGREYTLTPQCVLVGNDDGTASITFQIAVSGVQRSAVVDELQGLVFPALPVRAIFQLRGHSLVAAFDCHLYECESRPRQRSNSSLQPTGAPAATRETK